MTKHDALAAIVEKEMLRRWRERVEGWRDLDAGIVPRKPKKTFPSPDMVFWDKENMGTSVVSSNHQKILTRRYYSHGFSRWIFTS